MIALFDVIYETYWTEVPIEQVVRGSRRKGTSPGRVLGVLMTFLRDDPHTRCVIDAATTCIYARMYNRYSMDFQIGFVYSKALEVVHYKLCSKHNYFNFN